MMQWDLNLDNLVLFWNKIYKSRCDLYELHRLLF